MSRPQMTGGGLLAGATLFELSPLHVDEGVRIGFLHEDKAAALGRLMAVDGQRDPIKVVANPKNPEQPWRLVTGMHRLHGARIEAITVWAIEVRGNPEELADLEASENLHRRRLGAIERAKFVAALAEAARDRIAREHGNLKQQQLAIKTRWARVKANEIRVDQALQEESDDTTGQMSAVYGWQESIADAVGLDARTIRRSLRLHRLLVEPFPELIRDLAAHPVVGENEKQLRDIADVRDEAQRRRVIEILLQLPDCSAEEARILAKIDPRDGPAPPVHVKYGSQIEGGWARLNLQQQRAFIPNIAAMMGTAGLKRELRDRLNAELGVAENAPLTFRRERAPDA